MPSKCYEVIPAGDADYVNNGDDDDDDDGL